MKEILLTTVKGVSTVTVDGETVFSGGRVDAKREANRLAKANGTTWGNVKENGKVVTVTPK